MSFVLQKCATNKLQSEKFRHLTNFVKHKPTDRRFGNKITDSTQYRFFSQKKSVIDRPLTTVVSSQPYLADLDDERGLSSDLLAQFDRRGHRIRRREHLGDDSHLEEGRGLW